MDTVPTAEEDYNGVMLSCCSSSLDNPIGSAASFLIYIRSLATKLLT